MNDRTGTTAGPEHGPEPGPVSVPAAAQALGISERAVRKRIHAGTLRAQPFGRSFKVWLPDDARPAGPEPGPASGPEPGPEPIEGRYTTTPAEVERAIEATATRYVADFAGLYDRINAEVGARYEQTIAAKDETIATQADALADLRRQLAEARSAPPAAPPPPSAAPTPSAHHDTPDAQRGAGGLWARLRRAFGYPVLSLLFLC